MTCLSQSPEGLLRTCLGVLTLFEKCPPPADVFEHWFSSWWHTVWTVEPLGGGALLEEYVMGWELRAHCFTCCQFSLSPAYLCLEV